MISQPYLVETKLLQVIKIMGMDVSTFLLVMLITLLIIGFGIYYWWQSYKRNKNIEEAKGKVLCEITPISGGQVKRKLCEMVEGEAKEIIDKSRGTFMLKAFIKVPEGSEAVTYYAFPEHDYLDVYPYEAPPSQQIPIVKYYFTEGDPFPKLPHDPAKWDVERVTRTTTAFARLAREESVAQTMLGQFSGFFEGLIAALPNLKKIPMLVILQIIILVGILAVGYLEFSSGQTIAQIGKSIVGK